MPLYGCSLPSIQLFAKLCDLDNAAKSLIIIHYTAVFSANCQLSPNLQDKVHSGDQPSEDSTLAHSTTRTWGETARGHCHHSHHPEDQPPNLWAQDDTEAAMGGWAVTCSWQHNSSTRCCSTSTSTHSCLPFMGFSDLSVELCLTYLVSDLLMLCRKQGNGLVSSLQTSLASCWVLDDYGKKKSLSVNLISWALSIKKKKT